MDFVSFENEGQKEILDYSVLIERQRQLKDEIARLISIGMQREASNGLDKSIYDEISVKFDDFLGLTQKFIRFFNEPPSDEDFKRLNYAAILQKAYNEFRQFSDNLELLRLEEQSKKFSNEFTNFIETTQARLENVVSGYDEFLKNFISKQESTIKPFENHVDNIEKQLNAVVKIYDGSFAKMLKITKNGAIAVLFLNIFMFFILGALAAGVFFKSAELERVIEMSSNLENIKVTRDKDRIILNIPKDKMSIVDDGKNQKIILKSNLTKGE